MSHVVVHPSTMEGIKRLAKSLKREKNLSHAKALDAAAQAAGFQNLQHARNVLPKMRVGSNQLRPLYLSAYWRTPKGQTGRETLLIHTRQCWPELLRPQELFASRLRHFRIDADDHLETRVDLNGQSAAQDAACVAAATIQFMEASGLRPSTKAIPKGWGREAHKLPGKDHSTVWIDPSTEQFVVCDEPYRDEIEFLAMREAWAVERGLSVKATRWPGMYSPGLAPLYLLGQEQFAPALATIVRNLDRLPDPPAKTSWKGETAPYEPVFVSPGRKASGRVKRSRPRPVYPGLVRGNAIAYFRMLVGVQWRPHGKMPLITHKRVGELLKRLQELHIPSPAWHRIESVRSDLDEWIQREYTSNELSQEQFSEMYYGTSKATDTDRIAMVSEVDRHLKLNYPDCGPLRLMIRTLSSIRHTIEARDSTRAARKRLPPALHA